MPRLFLSAGDISGDQHAARLLTALHRRVPGLHCEGLGGPALSAAGMAIHEDLVSRAIIGIGPALREVPHLLGLLRRVAGILDARRPDVVVLVDYPGLNLYVARLAHRRGIPVVYFIAPQLWAWAPWRARRFARVVDEALVLFPFEQGFFRRAGMAAHHIGHPVLDGLPAAPPLRREITQLPAPVALLPGSRRREVATNLPIMLAAAAALHARQPQTSFHSAHVDSRRRDEMAALARAAGVALQIHADDVHGVMASCRCAAVASGTATLETAALDTPLVVFYRITRGEELIRRHLLVAPWISQVNLVAGREVVQELLPCHDDPGPLSLTLEQLLDEGTAAQQRRDLEEVRAAALGPGAVERAAAHIAPRLSQAGSPARPG